MRSTDSGNMSEKQGVICPKCGAWMGINRLSTGYLPLLPPDPLRYGEKLTDWPEILVRATEVRR
jgi:hypothetical protein